MLSIGITALPLIKSVTVYSLPSIITVTLPVAFSGNSTVTVPLVELAGTSTVTFIKAEESALELTVMLAFVPVLRYLSFSKYVIPTGYSPASNFLIVTSDTPSFISLRYFSPPTSTMI